MKPYYYLPNSSPRATIFYATLASSATVAWRAARIVGSLKLVLAGVVARLGSALGVTRLMSSFLYGVKSTDLLSFAAAALLVALVGLAASLIPACRASRVDPLTALRYE
jgi:ABC-type antimicrobial peptide transport system permease subunit